MFSKEIINLITEDLKGIYEYDAAKGDKSSIEATEVFAIYRGNSITDENTKRKCPVGRLCFKNAESTFEGFLAPNKKKCITYCCIVIDEYIWDFEIGMFGVHIPEYIKLFRPKVRLDTMFSQYWLTDNLRAKLTKCGIEIKPPTMHTHLTSGSFS